MSEPYFLLFKGGLLAGIELRVSRVVPNGKHWLVNQLLSMPVTESSGQKALAYVRLVRRIR